MKNNNEHINLELIARKLSGELEGKELDEFNKLMDDEHTAKAVEEYMKIWNLTGNMVNMPNVNVEDEWQKMQDNIDSPSEADSSGNRKSLSMSFILRIAAVFIMVGFVGYLTYSFYTNVGYETAVAEAEINEAKLPDGSSVTLNRNTVIEYPKSFNNKVRAVTLKGEAFFDVESDPAKPFVIDAGDVFVRVLGTSFYVNNNVNSDSIEVVVLTGRVAVIDKKDTTHKVILEPGDKAVYNRKAKTIIRKDNRDENYLSWKTRKLVFKNKKLKNVVKTLNKVYLQDIEVPQQLENCRVTVTFENKSFDAVIRILESTLNVKARKKNHNMLLEGNGC